MGDLHEFCAALALGKRSAIRNLPSSSCTLIKLERTAGHWGDAHDRGGVAGVAGVEDAAHFLVALEEAVGSVNEQGRLKVLDDAEEGGATDIGGGYSR
jgi:hypothetical protein